MTGEGLVGGAGGSQPRLALLIVQDLDLDRAKSRKLPAAFNGRILGAPEAAEGHLGVRLLQAPGNLGSGKTLPVERL